MRLNPEYLRTYKPEEIDDMEWETLETAITLWIQHLTLAVKTVLVSERKLCNQVLAFWEIFLKEWCGQNASSRLPKKSWQSFSDSVKA
jgi:hypothetical protein